MTRALRESAALDDPAWAKRETRFLAASMPGEVLRGDRLHPNAVPLESQVPLAKPPRALPGCHPRRATGPDGRFRFPLAREGKNPARCSPKPCSIAEICSQKVLELRQQRASRPA